jgi:hypothetical protein
VSDSNVVSLADRAKAKKEAEPAKREPSQKEVILLDTLTRGQIQITIDAGHEGVKVPKECGGDALLKLNLNYGFRNMNLVIEEKGAWCTLSFHGVDQPCYIPWDALYRIVEQGAAYLFLPSVPWHTKEFSTAMYIEKDESGGKISPATLRSANEQVQ